MGKYKGYFNGLDGKHYVVKLESADATGEYTEILLSGQGPFTVRYNDAQTLFEPSRTSTATIKIVHNDYLEDILTPYAHGTKVFLNEIIDNVEYTRWCGYLTPRLYNQGYEEEYEVIELEASDCLASLQYFDYEFMNSGGFVTFKEMIDYICDTCGLLSGYYWTRSKKVSNTVLLPNHLKVSETNWGYNDVDENIKLSEVLDEICRYLGFTAVQWEDKLYFIDYQYFHSNNDLYATWYSKATGYAEGGSSHLTGPYTVTADSYREDGAQISFLPIYNHAKVIANYKTAEDIIASPFADDFLVNRNGDFYASEEVLPIEPYNPKYQHGGVSIVGSIVSYATDDEFKKKETDKFDDSYRYFMRLYDSRDWESVYRNQNGVEQHLSSGTTADPLVTRNYRGGTIVDLGVVRKEYRSEYQQWIVPSKLDYTRYLCICEKRDEIDNGTSWGDTSHNAGAYFRTKQGLTPNVKVSDNAFLVLSGGAIFEKHPERNYINPNWGDGRITPPVGAPGAGTEGGARLIFLVQIGDKYWTGREWSTGTSKTFSIELERTQDEMQVWNSEQKILNNISWDMYVNKEGYKIPLSGIDTTQEITIEIHQPRYQWRWNTGSNKFHNIAPEANAYCWLTDLDISIVEKGQDKEKEESDIYYENMISEDSVNELQDITCKLTTYIEDNPPAYSNVIYTRNNASQFLISITEDCLSGNAQKPEENIIERYVRQYDTTTKSLSITLPVEISPFTLLKGAEVENPNEKYCVMGTEIDYSYGRQTINMINKK